MVQQITENADLGDYIPLGQKGVSNGVATLDGSGRIPAAQLTAAVVTDSDLGAANGVATLDATGKVPVAQIPSGGGGGIGTLLHKAFDGTVISDSTTPYTALSITVPAGTLGTDGVVRMRMLGLIANDNTGGTVNWRIKVNWGGVEIYNDAFGIASAATVPNRAWILDLDLFAKDNTALQHAIGLLMVGPNGNTSTGNAGDLNSSQEEADAFASIEASADSTSDQPLSVTIEMDTQNAGARFQPMHTTVIAY